MSIPTMLQQLNQQNTPDTAHVYVAMTFINSNNILINWMK